MLALMAPSLATITTVAQLFQQINMVSVGYFASWNYDNLGVKPWDIPAKCLTHTVWADADISKDGEITLGDPITEGHNETLNTKWQPGEPKYFSGTIDGLTHPKGPVAKCNPKMKFLISVGGWTFSSRFSLVARTHKARVKFARSVIKFCETYNFHGIDMDWEYPINGGADGNAVSPHDKENFVKLLREIRRHMDNFEKKHKGRGRMLLTASTTIDADLMQNYDLLGMAKYLDWFNLMIYDIAGSWNNVTSHNAGFPDFVDALQRYRGQHVPSSKLVTAIPLFGKVFQGVNQSQPGAPYESVDDDNEPPVDAIQKDYNAEKGYKRFWDPVNKAAYLYNQENKTWVTYEDPEAAAFKTRYLHKTHTRGFSFWDITNNVDGNVVAGALEGVLKDIKGGLQMIGLLKKSYRQQCYC